MQASSFYTFNVKYAEEPEKLSVEMADFLSSTEGRLPSNRADIYFKELGSESPILVKLMMKTIHQNDERTVKHIGVRQFGIRFLLRGLYAHNGLLYLHTRIDNETNLPYSVDFISFKVVDKKVARRTAIQEQVLQPLRAYHEVTRVRAEGYERTVFVLEQFTLSEDKQLEVRLYERGGGRTLAFYLDEEDLLLARKIDKLQAQVVSPMKKLCLLLACAVCGFFSVNAQRLIPRQQGIELIASVPLIKGEKVFSKEQWGVGVSLTKYLKRASYAFLLAEYEEQRLAYRDYEVPMRDVLLQVGYMQPLLSDRGKNIFTCLGISALGGYEELNEEKSLLPDGATLLDRSRLVYGGALHSSIECFLSDRLLLVLKAQGRLLLGSDLHRFRPALALGLRFNL